jgi:3-deoxy-D-manno-octulosonic-acid transferase
MARLKEVRPALNFVLTTGTVTSAGLAARRLPAGSVHQYAPLDAPEYARRFLDHWAPDVAVFTESEIWPNLILETSARGIPLALVNARISARSRRRWMRNRGLAIPLFSRFDIILAQTEGLVRHLPLLGARRVKAVGNLKIDSPPPPVDAATFEQLRKALRDRPRMLAASTHEGEDEIVAAAHRAIAREIAGFCTIIAPRHPERGTAIAERLKALGLTVAQRSLGELPDAATDIYIADTIGELGTLYALSPVALIGGSLINHGGQNPIEAVGHGTAVLTGPHWHNFRDVYRTLLRHKGAVEVSCADELQRTILTLMRDASELDRMRAGAKAAMRSLSGALERTVTALEPFLPAKEDIKRAS